MSYSPGEFTQQENLQRKNTKLTSDNIYVQLKADFKNMPQAIAVVKFKSKIRLTFVRIFIKTRLTSSFSNG